MAIVQFRVDDDIKKQASELFESLGLDLSTALRSFLRRSLVVGGFPYPMTINGKVEGVSISLEKQNEVKELLKKIDQIEYDEVKNALDKCEDLSEDDEYGRIALKYINKQIKLAREERRAGDDLLRDDRH
ncbi:MAG: type II toxin-antitoxin system RelB/DinJ family antitoxin [Bacilli bacterium]|nr:type II toxin-antitoxin system RelB/DinJ family antitoxin [Bacilli bacterium]